MPVKDGLVATPLAFTVQPLAVSLFTLTVHPVPPAAPKVALPLPGTITKVIVPVFTVTPMSLLVTVAVRGAKGVALPKTTL